MTIMAVMVSELGIQPLPTAGVSANRKIISLNVVGFHIIVLSSKN